MALSTQDLQLAEGLMGRGLKSPKATIAEARRAGLPLSYALAFLEKESTGTDADGTTRFGLNLFGHDAVRNPVKGGFVTQARYSQYRTNRQAGLGMQGVGPCQLTWYEFQDRADSLGGCWMPSSTTMMPPRTPATPADAPRAAATGIAAASTSATSLSPR